MVIATIGIRELATNVWGQAFSAIFGVFGLFVLIQAWRRIRGLIRFEYEQGRLEIEAIRGQLALPSVADELDASQLGYIERFILPKYNEHRRKYLTASVVDTLVSLLSSSLSLAIAIISGTQIVNSVKQVLIEAAGEDAIILQLILEPQEIVAALAAIQVVVQGISKLLQLSERTLNHRFAASRLFGEIWEFLGKSHEYAGGYAASFSQLTANTSQIVSVSETQLLQQQGPQINKRVQMTETAKVEPTPPAPKPVDPPVE